MEGPGMVPPASKARIQTPGTPRVAVPGQDRQGLPPVRTCVHCLALSPHRPQRGEVAVRGGLQ